MKVIVVGCGRVGAELAHRLFQKGHKVTIIDQVAAAFENLAPDFRGRTLEGEVLNQEVLQRAGITSADALAAVTNSDSLNVVVAHIARTVYHLSNVIARNYDPHWRPVHEVFGSQVVSSASWGAQRIEEMLYQVEMRTLFSAGNGEIEICELVVPESWQGHSLPEVLPKGDCLPVALTRGGQAMLPSGDTRLQAGDIVHLSTTMQGIEALRTRLARPEEE
jgi:trk system potassium uptake protein TrkA